MKRYFFLLALTALAIVLVSAAPEAVIASSPAVSMLGVAKTDLQTCVYTTGKIEYSQCTEVKVNSPVVFEKILVSEGQTVKKGQVLFTIDKQATKEALSSYAQTSGNAIPSSLLNQIQAQGAELEESVTAPSEGIVTSVAAVAGKLFDSTQAAAVIVNGNQLQVRANIGESDISKVKVGQAAVISGVGFEKSYQGKVAQIASSATQVVSGSTVQTVVGSVITIDAPDEQLKNGYTAKVKIITSLLEDVVTIPYEAVYSDNGKSYIYKLNGCFAEKCPVQTGAESELGIEIKEGLIPGEKVVRDISRLDCTKQRVRVNREGQGQ